MAFKIRYKKTIIILIDLLSFLLSVIVSMVLRYGQESYVYVLFEYQDHIYIRSFLIITVLYAILDFVRYKKYSRFVSSSAIEQTLQSLENHCALLVISVILMFATQTGYYISRRLVAYILLFSLLIDLILRIIFVKTWHYWEYHQTPQVYQGNWPASYNEEKSYDQQSLMIEGHVVGVLPGGSLPGWTRKNAVKTEEIRHVFAIGSKGIPASYGGFESFVENLTRRRQNDHILYHVARLAHDEIRFEYNDSVCFDVDVPDFGAAKAVYYDCAALGRSIRYCRRHEEISKPVFFIMACRIGPFIKRYVKKIHAMGGLVMVNPDGHEWKRAKWNYFIRRYWKFSEKLMVRNADLLICDSKNIEKYIQEEYAEFKPKTTYIAYGSDITPSTLKDDDPEYLKWMQYNRIRMGKYYLIVGRFVPENNFETMLREFKASDTKKDLVIITTNNDPLMHKLDKEIKFSQDPRIKFVGTVYNDQLLKKIRENAYAYIHGHEVGGTNPSLLEALSSTKINLLLDVGFNREVAEDAGLYWDKKQGSLSSLINKVDQLDTSTVRRYSEEARQRIEEQYSWNKIVADYERKWFCRF